uniref:Apple domain-containing protein n=1 Tax=Romanomermis culicivorax TaxID=13658 RepID=A0A915ITM4_ROMCU
MGHCALYYKDTIFEVERYLYSEKGRGDQCGFIGRFFQDDNFNNGFGIQDGCSYKNSEIKNENIQTADGCLDACLKDYSCTHFTWKATPTMCSLKHDNTKKDIDNSIEKDPGSKCGFVPTRFREIVDAYGIEIKDSCKFDEEQFDKFTTSSIDHCLNRCFQHSVCNHFMWDIGNRECYLYFSYLNHQVATNFQFQLGFKCGLIKKFIQEMDMNYDKKIKDNCNYKGMDIYKKGKYTSSAEKCKTICIENPTCTHFTWFGQPNNNGMTFCFLKKAATKRQIDKTIEKSSRNKCGLNEKILSGDLKMLIAR